METHYRAGQLTVHFTEDDANTWVAKQGARWAEPIAGQSGRVTFDHLGNVVEMSQNMQSGIEQGDVAWINFRGFLQDQRGDNPEPVQKDAGDDVDVPNVQPPATPEQA